MEPASDEALNGPLTEVVNYLHGGVEGFLGGDGVEIPDTPENQMSSSASSQKNMQERSQVLWSPKLVQFGGPCCRL